MAQSADQLEFLAEAGRVLGESFDLEVTLADVARLFVERFGDICVVDLFDGAPRRVAALARDPALQPLADELRRYPPRPDHPAMNPMHAGEVTVIPEFTAELRASLTQDARHRAIHDALDLATFVCAPLFARGRALGAITVGRRAPGKYSAAEVQVIAGVADRAALAVANARLYAAEHAARTEAEAAAARAERLQRVTAALAGALTPQHVAQVILGEGLLATGAAAAAVTVVDEAREHLDVLGYVGYDPAVSGGALVRWPLRADAPLSQAFRTGKPVFVSSRTDLLARFERVPAALHHQAWAALPLVAGGECIGALGVSFREEHAFDAGDRAFLSSVAGLCGQALHRARLYASERHARADAEDAVRVREDFLSIAAHELRTPLTPLLLQLGLLRRELTGTPEGRKVELALRQAERLSRLTTNLLDVARVGVGSFAIELAEVDLADVTRGVLDRHVDEAEKHGVRFHLDAQPVRGKWDGMRIDQVVTNLVSNAVKYGSGKPVSVLVRRTGERARVEVRDQGIGIAPEAQGNLFQRFTRVTTGAQSGGLGLGLFISQKIAEAHGGTLTLTSAPGSGSSFVLELPGVLQS